MKIDCLHGYFRFSETAPGQLSRFMSVFDVEIERSGDHYTFSDLVDAPTYSLPLGAFLDAPTKKTFEGPPWEVMRENDLVYDFTKGLVVPILSITQVVGLSQAGRYFVSAGMLLPGSLKPDGSRVRDYSGFYSESESLFRYSSVEYA